MKVLQILVLVLGATVFGNAQNEEKSTTLTGVVVDQLGAVIPDTKVTLTNIEDKLFETLSNQNGMYRMNIPSGTYSVVAEYTKHQAWERFKIEKFEIALTEKITLDLTLRVSEEFTKKYGTTVTGKINDNQIKLEGKTTILSGTLFDKNGAIFPFTKVEVRDIEGKITQTKSNGKGEFTIKLPLGIFIVSSKAEINSALYKSEEIKVEIIDFDEKKQNLTLLCTEDGKGRCPIITTSYCN